MNARKVADEKRRKKALREGFIAHLESIILGARLSVRILDSSTGEVIVPDDRKVAKRHIRALVKAHDRLSIDPSMVRVSIMKRVAAYQAKLSGEDGTGYGTSYL